MANTSIAGRKTNMIPKMIKVAAICAAFAFTNHRQTAQASSAELEVQVAGVPGWVVVKMDAWPRYGGRVVYEPSTGRYVTDDVARGEKIKITVTPGQGEVGEAYFGIICFSEGKWLVPVEGVTMPYATTLPLPTNP